MSVISVSNKVTGPADATVVCFLYVVMIKKMLSLKTPELSS